MILFSRDDAAKASAQSEHEDLVARCDGVELLSSLDLDATPPFDYAHDHFGYRDRHSQPVIEGSGDEPTPGTGTPLKPGEFILGYPDEDGPPANLPQPEVLAQWQFHGVSTLRRARGRFRDFLRANGESHEEQELIAAKLMGRWRSGAPLVLAPDKDDPALGADPQRNNNFNYKEMDPLGYAVPLGSHMRRMNPRDTAANMNRRRMIRRGATYGPHLPEGSPDDGVERGIAAFVICASLIRQFESRKTCGSTTATFTNWVTKETPSSATRTARWSSRFPSDRSARQSKVCRCSRRFAAARTFFFRASRLNYIAGL